MNPEFTHLEKSLALLEQSLSYVRSNLAAGDPGVRAQVRAAAIHGFEIT